MKTTTILLVAIFAILGVLYALLPHEIHVSSGIGFGLAHNMHIALGVVFFVLAGLSYYLLGRK